MLIVIGIADGALHFGTQQSPRSRHGLEQQIDVGDADVVDAALVEIRRERDAGHGRVAAVAAAVNADALGVGDSFLDRPLHRVGDVVLHLGAPFAPAGAIEGVAVTRRAAEIDLQYRIATVGHELHGRIEAPEVTGSRTAVRVDDHGQVPAVAARRHGEEPGQFEPVSCGDRDGAHLPERLAIEPVIGDREFFEFVFVAIEKEIGRRVAAVPDRHNHLRLVFAHARGTNDALGKCRFDASDDRSPLRIDEMSAGPGIVIGHGNNVILDIRRPDTADIDIGMLEDELADRVVGEVVFIDCRLVALGPIGMDVRAHVHALAVIADPRGRIAASGFFEFDEQVPVMLAGFPVVNTAFATLEHEFTDDIAALVGQPAGDVARVEFDCAQATVHDVHPFDVLDDHAVIEARG